MNLGQNKEVHYFFFHCFFDMIFLSQDQSVWVFCIAVFLVIAFSIGAALIAAYSRQTKNMSADTYHTARKTQKWPALAWTFFSGSIGAWAISFPAILGQTGWHICFAYGIACSVPVIIVVHLARFIKADEQTPFALSDKIDSRFGKLCGKWIAVVAFTNMAAFLVGEYIAIGTMYKNILDLNNVFKPFEFSENIKPIHIFMVCLVGISTLAYTFRFGLPISIITDKFQGLFSLTLVVIIAFFVGFEFDFKNLEPTEYKVSHLWESFGLIFSIIASGFVSEVYWQRVWAAKSNRDLMIGGYLGAGMIFAVVFVLGFCGNLLARSGNELNYTTPLFSLFLQLKHSTYIISITVFLGTIMCLGAVDSLQSGLGATLCGSFGRTSSLLVGKVLVVLLNIPLIIFSAYFESIECVMLFVNTLSACVVVPFIIGFLDKNRIIVADQFSVIFSNICAVLGLSVFGIFNPLGDQSYNQLNIWERLAWTWYNNQYSAGYLFVVAIVVSVVSVVLCGLVRNVSIVKSQF